MSWLIVAALVLAFLAGATLTALVALLGALSATRKRQEQLDAARRQLGRP